MIGRLIGFWRLAPSRRRQRISFAWTSFITRYRYGRRLLALGRGSLVGRPLFWTPEYVAIGTAVLIWPGSRFEGIDQDPSVSGEPPRIIIGDGVSFQQSCHVTAARHVEIGAGTSVLFGVMITDTDHRYDDPTQPPALQPLCVRPTIIGENCFIGARASIQAGTRLGRHCIIGTNAVVRGEFPDHCVLVGAPARVVKRFDPASGQWRRTTSDGQFVADATPTSQE